MQAHGSDRADSGFTVEAMVSEYRALRASVIRLWTEENRQLDASDVDDLVRFSESIDQSLAESTSRFTDEIDHTKETFLGILGHDLRTPLGAMITSGQFILEVDDLATAHKMAPARKAARKAPARKGAKKGAKARR
ncbi:MAG: HAMP domain-containing histidine kinase [Gemmatimonadetes bacterium]|nr:HAMP domain-containing histidine kinase [Gemmatimonadota bacterium]